MIVLPTETVEAPPIETFPIHQAKRAKPPSAAEPPTERHNVQVLFGTDRKVIVASTGKPEDQFSHERGPLRLGLAEVSIPPHHRVGEVERPSWLHFELSEDPDKHVILKSAQLGSSEEFKRWIDQLQTGKPNRTAFVFVHGYNVSFQVAALRTAQMAYDLGIDSLPAFFSWPSQGKLSGYPADEANAEWTEPHVKAFLALFADQSKAGEIYVVAHSMGSRPTTRALAALLRERADLRPRFRELVLAAPDFDAAVFKEQFLPTFMAMGQHVTLYASSKDKALKASDELHGGEPRLGQAGSALFVEPGIETVDASQVDTDFLGHSYIAASATLLTDLRRLLHDHLRAPDRPKMQTRGSDALRYWVLTP